MVQDYPREFNLRSPRLQLLSARSAGAWNYEARSSALVTDEGLNLRHRLGVELRADAQRLKLPFTCPCFSLAWARKNTARAAGIGIAGLFIVGIAVPFIERDRFAACLAGMMVCGCSGR